MDFDVVDFTNLQRQVIHGTRDVGRKKLDSAADKMRDINPNVQIDSYEVALDSENAIDIISDTTWSSTAPIISPRATWSTTPA